MIDGDVATSSAVAQVDAGSTSGPSASVTGRPPSASIAGGELVGRTPVVDRHAGAGVGQEASQGEAAAGQPEHRHRPAGQRPGTDRVDGQRIEVDRLPRRHRRHCNRSSEARNRVTPSSAARIADDPEPDRDLLLVPAAELEVVVDRAEPEQALAAGQP